MNIEYAYTFSFDYSSITQLISIKNLKISPLVKS